MNKINIQDQLLYQARREKAPIKIFLLRGLQLTGRISAYDMYSVLLESQGRLQLIFKHAISTIEFPEKMRVGPSPDSDHSRGDRRGPPPGLRPHHGPPMHGDAPAHSPSPADAPSPEPQSESTPPSSEEE